MRLSTKYKLAGDNKLLISQTPQFGPGETDDNFAQWAKKGITAFCTLVEGQSFKTFEKIKREFNLENRNMFR